MAVKYLTQGGRVVQVNDDPESVAAAIRGGAQPLDPNLEMSLRRRERDVARAESPTGAIEAFGNAATMGLLPVLETAAPGVTTGEAKDIALQSQLTGEAHPVAKFAGAVAPAAAMGALGLGAGAARGIANPIVQRAAALGLEQGIQSGIAAGAETYLQERHLNTDPAADSETIAAHVLQNTLLGFGEGALVGGLFGAGEGALGSLAARGKKAVAGTLSRDAIDSGAEKHFRDLALSTEEAKGLGVSKGANGDTLGEVMYGPRTVEEYKQAVTDAAVDRISQARAGNQEVAISMEQAAQKHGVDLAEHFNNGLKEMDDIVRDMPSIKRGMFDMADVGAENKLAAELVGLKNELKLNGAGMRELRDLGEGDVVKGIKEARAALAQAERGTVSATKLAEGLERAREGLARRIEGFDTRNLTPAQAKLVALEARIGRALSDEAVMGTRAAKGYQAIRKFGDEVLTHDANAAAFITKDAKGVRTANKGAWVEAVKGMDGAKTAEQVKKALGLMEASGRFRNEVLGAVTTGQNPGAAMQMLPPNLIPTAKPAVDGFKKGIAAAIKERDVAKLVESAMGQSKKLAGGGVGNQAAGVALFSLLTGHNPLISAVPLVAGKVKSAVSEVLGANPLVSAARIRNWQIARQYGRENLLKVANAVAEGKTAFAPTPKFPGGPLALLGKLQTVTPQSLTKAVQAAADVMPQRGTMAAVAAMQAVTYLTSVAPKPLGTFKDVDPVTQRLSKEGFAADRYDPVELRKFERRASAVMDPSSAFARWGKGQLTQEEAEALRATHPKQVQEALEAVHEAINARGGKVSFSTSWRYKMLAPPDANAISASMSTDFLKSTQEAYAKQMVAASHGQNGGDGRAPVTATAKMKTDPAMGAAPSVALDAQMRTR